MKRNEKPLSLAALAETFEGLAEKFNSSATLLAKENSLDSPRHEVDMIYAVQAGTCLLKALDQGFLESGAPPAWDLREKKRNDLLKMRFDIATHRAKLKAIRERAAKSSIYSHDGDEVFAELKRLERVPIESQQQMLAELRRNVESFIDPQSENWPLTATSSWQAFIRLELIGDERQKGGQCVAWKMLEVVGHDHVGPSTNRRSENMTIPGIGKLKRRNQVFIVGDETAFGVLIHQVAPPFQL